jgi:hypothetical protein
MLMSCQNYPWVIPNAIDTRQIALKYINHQRKLCAHIQPHQIWNKEIKYLIIRSTVWILVEKSQCGGKVDPCLVKGIYTEVFVASQREIDR